MLKERVKYLCKQNGISQKKLVEGLVTPAHMTNILAGKYSLAPDLAQIMAERLGVKPAYLLKADDFSESIASEIDEMCWVVLCSKDTRIPSHDLPIRADELSMELALNMKAACLYLAANQAENYKKICELYLDFYVPEFTDEKIERMHPSLKKIFYIYKIQLSRSKKRYDMASYYLTLVLDLVRDDADIWIMVQKFRISAAIELGNYDFAQEIFATIFVETQNRAKLEQLSSLYVMRSAFYDRIKLYNSAILDVAKAEESIIYLTDPEEVAIRRGQCMHNRILILLKMKKFKDALTTVENYEKILRQNPEYTSDIIFSATFIYRVQIFMELNKWEALSKLLDRMEQINDLSDEQLFAFNFYKGQLYLHEDKFNLAEPHLIKAMQLNEKTATDRNWSAKIYSLLALVAEKKNKYKRAAQFYRKAYTLLSE